MFKPHDRYTAEFSPVLHAILLPSFGETVKLQFKGWYHNEVILLVWRKGDKVPKEHSDRMLLEVDSLTGVATVDERVKVMGTGKRPPCSTCYILDENNEGITTLLVEFVKVEV